MQVVKGSLDVPVPLHMTLPIDELQRRAEELEFSKLLDQACSCISPHVHDTHAAVQRSHGVCSLHTLSMDLQAAQKPKGSIERLLLVAAFAQSAFQAVGKLKCMYPISGETYEVGIFRPGLSPS